MDAVPGHFPVSAGTRLLLVDDSPKLCRMVKEYIEPLGYEVSLSHTGTEGLDKALQGDFHAVILDVMLTGLDGFEVLRRLRAKSTVPVLMLTGRGESSDRIAGLELLGADAVIRRSMLTAMQVHRIPQPPILVGDLTWIRRPARRRWLGSHSRLRRPNSICCCRWRAIAGGPRCGSNC